MLSIDIFLMLSIDIFWCWSTIINIHTEVINTVVTITKVHSCGHSMVSCWIARPKHGGTKQYMSDHQPCIVTFRQAIERQVLKLKDCLILAESATFQCWVMVSHGELEDISSVFYFCWPLDVLDQTRWHLQRVPGWFIDRIYCGMNIPTVVGSSSRFRNIILSWAALAAWIAIITLILENGCWSCWWLMLTNFQWWHWSVDA